MRHWLTFDTDGEIAGCHCGYMSTHAPDAYDWGDNVIRHIQAEAWDEGNASGISRAMRSMSDEPGLSIKAPNPYRSTP